MTDLLQHLAAPEDRVLFGLLALVVGYFALGAIVARRGRPLRPQERDREPRADGPRDQNP